MRRKTARRIYCIEDIFDGHYLNILMGEIMGTGVIMWGLYVSGKSTLGKVLAEKLRFHFIDVEELYFKAVDSDYTYSFPRVRSCVFYNWKL